MHLLCCLWAGNDLPDYSANKYRAEDVLALRNGFERFNGPVVLHVLADAVYAPKVRALFADRTDVMVHDLSTEFNVGGWTNVLQAFAPSTWAGMREAAHRLGSPLRDNDRVLLVGLDTVFTGDCSWLFRWNEAPVGLPPDPHSPATSPPCDAVVTFNAQGANQVWTEHLRAMRVWNRADYPHLYHGQPSEMVLLQYLAKLNGWPMLEPAPKRLLSYKVHVRGPQDVPPDTGVVYFHGTPKPRDLGARDVMRRYM